MQELQGTGNSSEDQESSAFVLFLKNNETINEEKDAVAPSAES